MKLIVPAICLALLVGASPYAEVAGAPVIVDGDTLHVEAPLGRIKLRLGEIVAPDRGERGYHEAADQLSKLAGEWVVCRLTGAVTWDRMVAYCEAGGLDLGMAMVLSGWAGHAPEFGNSYAAAEREARQARRGLWSDE